MPIWWRWYYWACPVSWTLYGLIASQFGDIKDTFDSGETVEDFLRSYFGYRNDFVGIVAIVIVGISVLFAFTFAYSIKAFNFQKRWECYNCKYKEDPIIAIFAYYNSGLQSCMRCVLISCLGSMPYKVRKLSQYSGLPNLIFVEFEPDIIWGTCKFV